LSEHLLDNGVLRKQVRLSRLCADRGQVYDSDRTRCRERRSQRGGRRPRLVKVWRRIEVRRNEHEHAFGPFECWRERPSIIDIRTHEVAAKLCPSFAFTEVAHHSSDRLVTGQKVARHLSTNFASDSRWKHCQEVGGNSRNRPSCKRRVALR